MREPSPILLSSRNNESRNYHNENQRSGSLENSLRYQPLASNGMKSHAGAPVSATLNALRPIHRDQDLVNTFGTEQDAA